MPPSTIQKERQKTVLSIIAAFLLVLLVVLYYAPFGCRNYLAVREDLNRVKKEISDLKAKNHELQAEIAQLQSDSHYVEKVARQQGMIKKNETVFEFTEKKNKKE